MNENDGIYQGQAYSFMCPSKYGDIVTVGYLFSGFGEIIRPKTNRVLVRPPQFMCECMFKICLGGIAQREKLRCDIIAGRCGRNVRR